MPKKNPVGRPKANITDHQLFNLAKLGFSVTEVALHFQVSTTTINNYCNREHGMNFFQYQTRAMVNTQEFLKTKALQLAAEGNTTMLRECLNNFCGWNRSPEDKEVQVNELESLTDEQLIERARQLTAEHQQLPEPDNIKTVSASGSELHKEELD